MSPQKLPTLPFDTRIQTGSKSVFNFWTSRCILQRLLRRMWVFSILREARRLKLQLESAEQISMKTENIIKNIVLFLFFFVLGKKMHTCGQERAKSMLFLFLQLIKNQRLSSSGSRAADKWGWKICQTNFGCSSPLSFFLTRDFCFSVRLKNLLTFQFVPNFRVSTTELIEAMYKDNNTKRKEEEEEEAEDQWCLYGPSLISFITPFSVSFPLPYLPYIILISFMMCWSYSGLGARRFRHVTFFSLISYFLLRSFLLSYLWQFKRRSPNGQQGSVENVRQRECQRGWKTSDEKLSGHFHNFSFENNAKN